MITHFHLLDKYEHWCCWQAINGKKVPGFLNDEGTFIPKDITKWHGVPFTNITGAQFGVILGHKVPDTKLILAGIDLDHCITDGIIEPWAQEIVDELDSYTEFSPSKNGLHILVLCQPDVFVGIKQGNLEVYTHDRYFTFTHNTIKKLNLKDCTEFIKQFASQSQVVCSQAAIYEPKSVSDTKLNAIANKILKAMFAGSSPQHEDRSGNDSYVLSYLLTHGFDKEECLFLMLDERFNFGNKHLERSTGDKYCYDTINNVYEYLLSSGKIKQRATKNDTDFSTFCEQNQYALWYDTWQQTEMCNEDVLDRRLRNKIKIEAVENGCGTLGKVDAKIDRELYLNQKHTLKDWFNTLNWQGSNEIGRFISCLTTETPDSITEAFIQYWFTNAVAKIYGDKERQNVVLVFHGKQGQYKSKAIMWLAPFFDWGASISANQLSAGSRDVMMASTRKLVVEIGELQLASRRMDAGSLKDFITKHTVHEQIRYERQAMDYLVTASYIGTTNDGAFLTDITGNRRFAVLQNVSIDWKALQKVDKEQLWAQAAHLYHSGAHALMPDDVFEYQQADNENRVTNIRSVLMDMIQANFNSCEHKDGLTNTEALNKLNEIEWLLDPNKHSDVMMVASVLKQLGYTSKQVKTNRLVTWKYDVNLALQS